MAMKKVRKSYLSNRFIMNKIDFYTCWEDMDLIQKSLQINSNDIIFSVTSGGCNILNFLVYNPKKILAVDYNPYQNYLLELKIEAIRNLNYTEFLQFMGITPSKERMELYEIIRKNLSQNASAFWDLNSFAVEKGILNVGEQNVKNYGKFLRFLKGRKTIENFFYCTTIEEQTDYFYKHIYGLPWRLYPGCTYRDFVIKLALCLRALHEYPYGRKRVSGYFRYIQKIHYPKDHLKKIEYVYTKVPIKYNHFASLMLLNRYINEDCFPPYLREENYGMIQQRIDRIETKTASVLETLRECPSDSITKFNLSNVFDWIADDIFTKQFVEITRVGKNGGKIFYSTTRDDRYIPKDIKTMYPYEKIAVDLLKEDRTMMYSYFEVGEICK